MKKNTFLLFILSLITNVFFAQRAIVLSNPQGKDSWIINVGDLMRYELSSDPNGIYTGEVQDIKDSSAVVSGQEIKFKDLRMIRISRKHGRTSITLGIFLMGIGAAVGPVNDSQGELVPHTYVTIAQVAFIGSGLYFFIKGIVECSSPHKCYFPGGWSIRTELVSKIKSE